MTVFVRLQIQQMLTPLPCSRDACGFRKIFKVRAGGDRANPFAAYYSSRLLSPAAYHSSRIPSPPADYPYLNDSLNDCAPHAPHAARQCDMLNQFAKSSLSEFANIRLSEFAKNSRRNEFAPNNEFATSALRRTLKVLPAPVAWSVGC